MDQWSFNVFIAMCEGAKLFILASFTRLSTELSFIFFNVIKTFNLVVGIITVWHNAPFFRTEFNTIVKLSSAPAFVKLTMILWTHFWIMCFLNMTFCNFEHF